MAELLSIGPPHKSLPETYIRPPSQRPDFAAVETGVNIPVVDLGSPNKPQIAAQIGLACESYGFFQVVNHGIPAVLILQMLSMAAEFFRLPEEEKIALYSDDPLKKVRLSTSFNVREEKVHNWRDYLRLHCYPLEDYLPDWPSKPFLFREVASTYCREVRMLGFRLLRLISLSLGLEEDYINRVLGDQEQHMAINYYPPCPQPDLTYGLPPHTDPNAITILLQDPSIAGLQVLVGGRWIAVDPHPDALVINIGDQLQALSNGRYVSVFHRAVVNSEKERMSVSSFLCPCNDAVIEPARQLKGEGTPTIYRSFTYGEYYDKFWTRSLDQECCLEHFRR